MNDVIKWRRLAKIELAKIREMDVQAERTIQSYIDMLEANLPIAEIDRLQTELNAAHAKLDRLYDDMPTFGDELDKLYGDDDE